MNDNLELEIWKDIKGYEGIYKISSFGKIKSLPRNGTIKKEKIIKQVKDKDGYLKVILNKYSSYKTVSVHRLVALNFIPNLLNLPQINHKDENKQNNQIDNLEWCSNKYNSNFGTRNERMRKSLGKEVFQYTLKGKFIKRYNSIREASKINAMNPSSISCCCAGIYKTSHGFIWSRFNKQ